VQDYARRISEELRLEAEAEKVRLDYLAAKIAESVGRMFSGH